MSCNSAMKNWPAILGDYTMNRGESIERLQKFYLDTREIGRKLAGMQTISDELDINPKTMPLYEMKIALMKYHDLARDMERDLDETQQEHFVKRENALLGGF